jgi:hypothetical protein
MPIPIVQSLFQQIFGSSLPTASLARPTESSDEEGEDVVRRGPAISFQDVLTRQFLGPTVLPKTIDTPSGKVFAPDDPIPAKPNILATYPEKEKETKIISSPMPAGEPKGLMGLPIPEAQDKLKGFEKPQDVDTNVLMNELTPENLQKQIKYKKNKINSNILDAYLEGKKIAEIEKNEDYKQGNAYNYKISWVDKNNEINADDTDMGTGLNEAKYITSVGFINSIKEKEKEYLNKLTNALDTKNYSLLNKERNYDFEDSLLRSEDFKSKIEKITPRIIDFYKEVAVERNTSNPVGSLIDKPLSDETY